MLMWIFGIKVQRIARNYAETLSFDKISTPGNYKNLRYFTQCVFRSLSNIYKKTICGNSWLLKAINYFCKMLRHICLLRSLTDLLCVYLLFGNSSLDVAKKFTPPQSKDWIFSANYKTWIARATLHKNVVSQLGFL